MNKALEKAIERAGGQSALARTVSDVSGDNIRQGHVGQWRNSKRGVPAQYVHIIERHYGIPAEELRPDAWPRGWMHERYARIQKLVAPLRNREGASA